MKFLFEEIYFSDYLSNRMKILIIQTSFIGDVVLATGILEKLNQNFPESKIDFLVRQGNEGLFENHPFLNRVLIWNKKNGKYRNLFRLLKEIKNSKYDKVINLQRFAASGFLTGFSKATERIGFEKNPLSFLFTKSYPHTIGIKNVINYQHEIDRNHALIAGFTDSIAAKPKLYPSKNDFGNVSRYKKQPYITIAPASVWFTKQFPKAKWVQFLDDLQNEYNVFVIGGKGDIGLCEEIKQNTSHEKIEIVAGKLSFLETVALMKDANMNYTNDSAPMHLASAMNAPVAAIFCSTIPEFGFGPVSDLSFILQEDENLSCRPCGLHGLKACPLGHFKCGFDIPTKNLVDLLK